MGITGLPSFCYEVVRFLAVVNQFLFSYFPLPVANLKLGAMPHQAVAAA